MPNMFRVCKKAGSFTEPSTSGLLSHCKFDGTMADVTGALLPQPDDYGIYGTVGYVTGVCGSALSMTSEDGVARVTMGRVEAIDEEDPYWQSDIIGFQSTICLWTNLPTSAVPDNPFSLHEIDFPEPGYDEYGRSLYIYTTISNKLGIAIYNRYGGSTVSHENFLSDCEWSDGFHFVCIRFDLANDRIILDVDDVQNVFNGFTHYSSFGRANHFGFTMQQSPSPYVYFDDVRIYTRTLSDAEVSGLHTVSEPVNTLVPCF